MANNLFKLGLNVSNEIFNNINKHSEIENQKSVEEMFERIGKGRTYTPTETYKPQEHAISGFANKNDALLFYQHMAEAGKKVVVAPVKINEQWLVDVRVNENERKAYSDEAQRFSEKYDIMLEEQRRLQRQQSYENGYEKSGSSVNNDLESMYKQELGSSEETRKLIQTVSKIINIGEEYNKDINNDSAFHSSNGSGNIRQSQTARTATVAGEKGDYTVIIGGKIIDNDSPEAKRIIKKHEKRLENAQTFVSETKKDNATTENRAVIDSLKGTSKRSFATSFKEIKENSKSILESSMKQEYYSNETKSGNIFNGGVLDSFIEQANTLHIIENKRSPKEVTCADGSKKNLNFSKEEKDIMSKLARAGGTGSAVLDRAVGLGTVTTYLNRIEIVNILAEAKGKGIVSDEQIQAVMDKVKLESHEQAMFTPKQKGAVGYSFGEDGRSDNTLSKMERELDLNRHGISLQGNINHSTMMNVNEVFFSKVSEYNASVARHNEGVRNGTIKGELKESIVLFKADGSFDKEALMNNYKKLGISKETAEKLGSLNEKGAFGNLTKQTKNKISNTITSKISGSVEDREVQQAIGQARQTVNYGRQLASTVKQANQAVKAKAEKFRIDHAKAKNSTQTAKPKTKKQIERAEKKASNAEKKAEKHIKKMKKKTKRMERFENSAFGKALNLKKKLEKEIAKLLSPLNAVKAYVMHIVGVGAMIVVTALGGLTVILIVLMGIQSLLSAPDRLIMGMLAPDTYEDTCMYVLYQKTLVTEGNEIEALNDFQGLFDGRRDVSYGDNYNDYDNYIANLDYLYDDGTSLFINPFNISPEDEENRTYMTKLTSFNGEKDILFKANANPFSNISDTNERFISTESGHTSNIKDILCMVDVMFQYDSDNYSDTQLESVLGMRPQQLDYKEFTQSFWGACKAGVKNVVIAGEKVCNWFAVHILGQENVDEVSEAEWTNRYAETEGGIISWKTLQNYVESLYSASHQESYNLDVNFYPITKAIGNIDEYEKNFYESNACVHGYCVNPKKNDFKIGTTYRPSTDGSGQEILSPYIKTSDGYVKWLWKEDENAVSIDMDDYLGNRDDLCFPVPEGTINEYTHSVLQGSEGGYNWIKAHSDNHDYNSSSPACWKMSEETIGEGQDEYIKKVKECTSDWCSTKEEAMADLETKLNNEYNNFTDLQGDTYNYNSATSYDTFVRNYSVKPAFEMINVKDTDDSPKPYNEIYGEKAEGWIFNGNNNVFAVRNYNPFRSNPWISWWDKSDSDAFFARMAGLEIKFDGYEDGLEKWGATSSTIGDWDACFANLGWFETDGDTISDLINDGRLNGDYGYILINVYGGYWKPMYRVTGSVVVEERHREIFNRECEGHEFQYCGGHLDATASCNVYSFTNEQMSMAGAYNNPEEMPQALDFMTEDRKKIYRAIEGKSITKNVLRDTIANASTTGMGLGITETPQGSFIGSQYGLNLYVNGSQWGEGISFPDGRKENIKFAKDIFDIDWLINKGYNVFPLSNPKEDATDTQKKDFTINKAWKNYEGWNSDNMTIACLKETANWYDLYQFDIPTEVDSFSVSEKDRKKFLEAIKENYGEDISEDRLKMVETALMWVGRGHYTEEPEHLKHDFLSKTCTVNEPTIEITDNSGNVITSSMDFSASCSATDSKGFALYCLKASGVPDNNLKDKIDSIIEAETTRNYGISTFKPADIIVHKAKEWKNNNISDVDLGKFGSEYAYDIYSVYIGTFSEEITIGDINQTITIPANEPVIVDIFKGVDMLDTEGQKSNSGYSCGIKLRYGKNTDVFFNDDHNCWCWLSNGKAIYKLDYEELLNT